MRSLIFTLVLSGSLMAASFSTRYSVDVGMFGKVGYADVSLEEDSDTYEMKLTAKMVGTAASLTGKRVETYISKGRIIEGRYVPDSFVKIKKNTRAERVQTYLFDHVSKEVRLVQENSKWVSGTKFDAVAFKLVKNEIQENSKEESVLEVFRAQDVLSSYLNAVKTCNAEQREYNLLAIGAHNDDRNVTLSFLDGLKREEVASGFSNEIGNIYNLHVQPIDSEEKTVDVFITFDNDGHMKEAVLGSVFWIGEVKAKRVYHQVSSN